MLPIKRQISPYNHSAVNNVQYLVLHDTGNPTDSDEGNANYFGGADRQASAHLFIDNDSITQVVEFTEASWHCGDGNNMHGINNHNSIGIEMCRVNNTVTAQTEANTVELVKYLMQKFNIPIERVVRHFDASGKICPSSFSGNNWARWTAFKQKLVQAPSTPVASDKIYGIVTASVLNVRKGRGTNFAVIGQLKKGDKIRLDNLIGDWWSIYFGDHGGFIHKDYVSRV